MNNTDFWVISEDMTKYEFSLINKARELADFIGSRVISVCFGHGDCKGSILAGADKVYLLNGLSNIVDDGFTAEKLSELVREEMPGVILFSATVRLRAIAPAMAAMLCTGLTADCTGLEIDETGYLIQTRPAFGNNLIAKIICERNRPQMATVRIGTFPEAVLDYGRNGEMIEKHVYPKQRIKKIGCIESGNNDSLRNADIIIAGGRGIGSREGFILIKKTADRIGACVGASRAAVDAGFAPYAWQIGQTGITVRPKLYVAVGIHGYIQHLAGMSGAEYVIAINNDAEAPIFRYADYGIVSDWRLIIENWLNKLEIG